MTQTIDVGTAPLAPVAFNPVYESNDPRFLVVIDGDTYVPSAIPRLEWGAHGVTDAATVTLPISNNPDFSAQLFRDADDNSPVSIQIYGGFPQNPSVSITTTNQLYLLFTGQVDLYTARFTADNVTFQCRNAAAPLVDTKITTYKPNWTSAQFIESVVPTLGLGYTVNLANSPATLQEVLGYDQIGGASLAAALYGMRIMDLILRCAQFDDADAWADTTGVFHYASPTLIQRNLIPLVFGQDIALEDGLEGTHSPQFSKNIQVTVHTNQRRTRTSTSTRITGGPDGSLISEQQSSVISTTSMPIFGTNESITTSTAADGTVTVSNSSADGGSNTSTTSFGTAADTGKEKYVFFERNVTPARANQIALNYWRQISAHEYSIVLLVPMRKALLPQLSITSKIKLSGCPYAYFNGIYYPRRITHEISTDEGWMVRIEAVNHQPSLNGV